MRMTSAVKPSNTKVPPLANSCATARGCCIIRHQGATRVTVTCVTNTDTCHPRGIAIARTVTAALRIADGAPFLGGIRARPCSRPVRRLLRIRRAWHPKNRPSPLVAFRIPVSAAPLTDESISTARGGPQVHGTANVHGGTARARMRHNCRLTWRQGTTPPLPRCHTLAQPQGPRARTRTTPRTVYTQQRTKREPLQAEAEPI